MTPHVSVVMPVRNGARWLGEAVESVLGQSFAEWELLAIDDGSTDGTPAILDAFAKRDGRVRVLRQDALGLVAALNRGFSEARGALLARLDADDHALPDRLGAQVRHLGAHPQICLLGSWAHRIDEHGSRHGELRPASEPGELAHILERTNPFIHSSVMLRAELARRLGGYRAAFRAAEDHDLWLRIAEVSAVANLPQPLVEYRRHGGNVTSRNAIRQAFSVRLALRSARARRETGSDPAAGLTEPPDWRAGAAGAAFYAEDAALYRLLDRVDESAAGDIDFSLIEARFGELNHAERSLAAQALINHMKHGERVSARRARSLFLRLLWKRPGMVPRSALASLPGALLR